MKSLGLTDDQMVLLAPQMLQAKYEAYINQLKQNAALAISNFGQSAAPYKLLAIGGVVALAGSMLMLLRSRRK